ncbi:MAG: hypothetical protein ACRD0D_07720, partial [Acidimicrobiales bacterium]
LIERGQMTSTAYFTAKSLVPNVAALADRRSALERRVAALEKDVGGPRPAPMGLAEIEATLAERIDAIGRQPGGEPLPILLDDVFRHLGPEAKWAALDAVDRLSGRAQVVYLADDPAVVTWARRRAATGAITHNDL